jgi:dihydroneopterin aldolase
MKRIMMMLLAPALLLAAGCGQAPNDKLAEAEKAVMDAKLAGAQAYVAEDYAKLDGMLTNAKKEMEDQNAKFALFRDYGKTEQLLTSVKAEAPKLIEETAKKKAEAKETALKAHEAAKVAVKKAQALVAKAPVGKDRAAVEAIRNDAKALTATLNEVQMAMDQEDYLTAQAKAKAVQDKSDALAAEVKGALAKVGGAKKK